jgi:MoaA/NifB/PqqE/SkfB family radical SAM enzyme
MAYIEISGACNANCVFCPGGPDGRRRGAFMPPALLEQILRKAKSDGFVESSFNPYNKGEPLLHPQLPEIFEVVRRSGLRLAISSNLIHLPDLNPSMLERITSVDISLSGFSNDTYKMNHRGGDVRKVISNILTLRDMRNASGSSFPIKVKWHRYRYNEHEIDAAREYFLSERIDFSAYYAFWGGAKEFEHYYEGGYSKEKLNLIEERIFTDLIDGYVQLHKFAERCILRDIVTINEGGQVMVCCAFSNARESVLGEYLSLSKEELQSATNRIGFCRKCMVNGWSGFFAAGI